MNSDSGRIRPVTALELEALGEQDKGRTVRLGDGLIGTVRTAGGTVSVYVVWRYRIGGRTREIHVGTWRAAGGQSLKDLRTERERLAALVSDGIDPIQKRDDEAAERERQRAERIEADGRAELERARRLTVRQLFQRWRAVELQPRKRADGKRIGRKDGGQWVAEQFERHVFPLIGERPIEDVRRADLLALIDTQKGACKLRTAVMLMTDLKQMLAFAVDRELLPANPLAGIKKERVGGATVERDRYLSAEEIRLLARSLPAARLAPRSEVAILLALATAVRTGELVGAAWSDALPEDDRARAARVAELRAVADANDAKLGILDAQAGTWLLTDSKNQRPHLIHLSGFALQQIERLAHLRHAGSPWVFSSTDPNRPLCTKSLGKQVADRQRNSPEARLSGRTQATDALALPGGRWTLHDLRRTAASTMALLGVADSTIHECLNHKQADPLSRIYIGGRREADQVRAFDALGQRLDELVNGAGTGSNVVPLARAA